VNFLCGLINALLLEAIAIVLVLNIAQAAEHRSYGAKHDFEVATEYPHGRPGYVVDHICALACGGQDDPRNMQWQSVADGKAKDRIERKHCDWFCGAHGLRGAKRN
jgi:hypothetical protein